LLADKTIQVVRQTALDAGAFGFLAKPFEDEVLVQLLHKAVAD
jgi:CheY-like chemotaxis protein